MFLTRLGRDARAVITGDITQVDLPDSERSGLSHARDVLSQVDGVAFVYLGREDIVRHPLVQRIVDAYDEREAVENADTNQPDRRPRPRTEPRRTEERNA
jgi:phosphate starvation-inducible PhoH-like protein